MQDSNSFYIEEVIKFSDEIAQAVRHLVAQLNGNYHNPSNNDIKEIIESLHTILFVARVKENRQIVGMITLVIFRIPYKKKGILEDLVVDSEFRNRGIGEALLKKVIDEARRKGIKTIDFTSHPTRKAANRLYGRLGFKKRDTNVYRIDL